MCEQHCGRPSHVYSTDPHLKYIRQYIYIRIFIYVRWGSVLSYGNQSSSMCKVPKYALHGSKHFKSSVSDSGVGVYVKETYCGEAWLCCIVSTKGAFTLRAVRCSTALHVTQTSKRERLARQNAAQCRAVLRRTARHCPHYASHVIKLMNIYFD